MQGTVFEFVPTANDPDGDPLVFSVANLPRWATFDSATGRIRGTPGAGDLGPYAGITISVSDGTLTASLPAFDLNVVATATGSATLSWQAPTQRTDGSSLTDLAGYKIYWGQSQGNYPNSVTIDNPGVSTYVIEQLTPATWYFVATAFDSKGVESQFSNVASKTIR